MPKLLKIFIITFVRRFIYGKSQREKDNEKENKKQFYISEGFAHGFLVLSDEAEFCYKVTDFYHPGDEGGLAWNDPAIGIDWQIPISDIVLSEKDKKHPLLKDLCEY